MNYPNLMAVIDAIPAISDADYQFSDRSSLTSCIEALIRKIPADDREVILQDVIDSLVDEDVTEKLPEGYSYRSYLNEG